MRNALLLIFTGLAIFNSGLAAQPTPTNESEYLAQRVQENLRRLTHFAMERKVDWSADEKLAAPVMAAVWSPASYQQYLSENAKGIRADSTDIALKTPRLLLDPTAAQMAEIGADLSEALHKHPAHPALHEHAALLVAILVLRESSGRFYDTRDLLCRVTAHLAFARFLHPELSAVGVLATAILEAEQGHAENALALAKSLPASLQDWQNIVNIRVTGDWRTPGASGSILYRLLHTRAFLAASNGQASQRIVDGIRLQDEHIRNRTDWFRSFLEDPPSRKYLLNKFSETTQMESAEMADVIRSFKMAPAQMIDSIALLNTPPGYVINPDPVGLPKFEVLDWGTWAAHFQRHICHNLNFVLGEQMIERQFFDLTLYPFIILQQRRQADGLKRHVIDRAIRLCLERPELINAVNRLQLSALLNQAAEGIVDPFFPKKSTPYMSTQLQTKPTLGFPPEVADFNVHQSTIRGWVSGVPAGSYYQAESRYSLIPKPMVLSIEKANPYLPFYAQQRVTQSAGETLAVLDKAAGPRAQYDLHVMRTILKRLEVNSPDFYEMLDRVVTISPLARLLKANKYYISGELEKAVEAFNQALETNVPPNLVAESSLWVIDFLLANGNGKQARELAEKAAGAGGLAQHQRFIRLLEASGKKAEAEQAVIRMQKHFPATVPLIRFYVQQGRLHGSYQGARNVSTALGEIKFRPRLLESERKAAFDAAQAIIFPGGKTTVKPGLGRPVGGLIIQRTKPGASATMGDILVAFNTVAVKDVYQYHFLRRETDAADASLMLWNANRGYYTIKVDLEEWDATTKLTFAESTENALEKRLAYAGKTKKLNLSRLGLTQIPKEVFSIKDLKSLDVMGNPLKSLPPEIGGLTNLEKLDVSGCSLKVLPQELGSLSKLVSLRAGENFLQSLPASLDGLQELELLYLKENDLEQFPQCITALKKLKYLVLSNNRLTELPDQVADLKELTALSLGRNEFTSYPKELLNLPKLEKLVLLDNNLGELPGDVGRMQGLKRLDLRGNRLTTLPESLTAIKGLTQLQLGKNCFVELPESLWKMTSLIELDLGANGVIEISPQLVNLKRLKRLVISSNRLAKFPPIIAELPELREVEYGGNYFTPEHLLVIINMAKMVKFSGDTYDKN